MVIFKQDRQPTLAIIPSNIVVQSNNYIEIHKKGKGGSANADTMYQLLAGQMKLLEEILN